MRASAPCPSLKPINNSRLRPLNFSLISRTRAYLTLFVAGTVSIPRRCSKPSARINIVNKPLYHNTSPSLTSPSLAPHKTLLDPDTSPTPQKHLSIPSSFSMKLTSTSLLLLTATSSAASHLSTRADSKTNIYICTDPNWAGTCTNMAVTAGKCYNMPAGFDENVSSTGPDEGTFCTLHS